MAGANEGEMRKDEHYTTCVNDVIEKERKRIGKDKDLCGLSLSGGGIRSAAFGLGVMQGLVAGNDKTGNVLKEIDYLSTVSGGGFIGSSLTWFLHNGIPGENMVAEKIIDKGISGGDEIYPIKAAGTSKETFPFGEKNIGGRVGNKRNKVLDFIRQHCNYLLPGNGLDITSLFAIVTRSMFVSLFVYFTLLTVVMAILLKVFAYCPMTSFCCSDGVIIKSKMGMSLICGAIILLIILAISFLYFSLRTRYPRLGFSMRYEWLIKGQKLIGIGWKCVFVLLIVGSVPYVCKFLLDGSLNQEIAAGSGSSLFGIITGFLKFRKDQNPNKSGDSILTRIFIMVAVFALIYGLGILAYSFGEHLGLWRYIIGLMIISALFGICVNLNYVGLHRMYRDRLMETFLPDSERVVDGKWGPALKADKALLSNMCKDQANRPYHLINTNIVLVDSPNSKFRGRGGDSFMLSPLFCGSDATGWRETDNYMTRKTRGVTLSTAMAISGAAVNPNAGVGGRGITRNKLVSTLMFLLNLRTGYWAPNPNVKKPRPFPPNFFFPGIRGGLLGTGLSEERRRIELTDGGHFENLGLYELVRRKLSVIIVSDAGADPDFHFADLANAVERVRVDFGAKIRFCESENGLKDILPDSESMSDGPKDDLFVIKYKLAKQGFAIGEIYYHDHNPDLDKPGILFYLKTTLTPGLPPDIYGYKSANKDFPDQSTADQFFDESQFEAYRELGYQITKKMLMSDDAIKEFGIPDKKKKDEAV